MATKEENPTISLKGGVWKHMKNKRYERLKYCI